MKVLYLVSGIGPPAGWGTEFIQNLIFSLSGKGVQATILNPIYLHTNSNWKSWIKEQERLYGVRIIPLEAPAWIKKYFLLHLALTPLIVTIATIKLLLKEKFDLIHEFSSTPAILFRHLIFRIFGIPSIFTLSVYNNTFLGSLYWINVFNFAKFYLIPSKELSHRIINNGIKEHKVVYASPGLDLKPFSTTRNKLAARNKLSLPIGKFIVTFFGSLTVEKGVGDLIDAIKILEKRLSGKVFFCFYTILKRSDDYQELKSRIEKINPHYVKLHEKYTHIPTLLAASDLVVLPQQTGHGTTIPIVSVIETISAKRFLVTTNLIGNRELINASNGILIPPKDPNRLAIAIEDNYLSIFKKELILKGRQPTIKDFDINVSINFHLQLYKTVFKPK